ncbi:MAG: hypothetical protein ACF8R7_04650 [Phycisphaerales bacterium JB039]
MGEAALVAELRDKGRQFVEILDSKSLSPTVAFWARPDDESDWVLIVSRPDFEQLGPRKSYESLQVPFRSAEAELDPLTFASIRVVPEKHPLIQLSSKMFKTGPQALANIHSAGNVINGVVLPDALIYRMAPSYLQHRNDSARNASD